MASSQSPRQRGRPRNPRVVDPRTGLEVPGLHFKANNGTYYSIPEKGKPPKLWGRDLLKAIDDHQRGDLPEWVDPPLPEPDPDHASPHVARLLARGKKGGTESRKRLSDCLAFWEQWKP
jgi:hypothetical protein